MALVQQARLMNLEEKLSLYHLDMQELLGSSDNENISDDRETVRRVLAEFIEATGRFTPEQASPPGVCNRYFTILDN